MPRKSKVEKSLHYNEILDMIKESISPRDISDYLKNEYNETISHTSINNFRKKIRSKTNQEYYKKKKSKNTSSIIEDKKAKDEKFDSVVAEGVSDLDSLDEIIGLGKNLGLNPSSLSPVEGPRGGIIISKLDVFNAKTRFLNVVIKAIDTKAKILKDEPDSPDINIFSLDGFDDDERQDIKKLAQSLAKSDTVE